MNRTVLVAVAAAALLTMAALPVSATHDARAPLAGGITITRTPTSPSGGGAITIQASGVFACNTSTDGATYGFVNCAPNDGINHQCAFPALQANSWTLNPNDETQSVVVDTFCNGFQGEAYAQFASPGTATVKSFTHGHDFRFYCHAEFSPGSYGTVQCTVGQ